MPQKQLTTYQAVTMHSVINRCLKACLTENLGAYNLSLTEWLMLGKIADAGPKGIRNTTIARSLRLDMPVVTKLVQKSTESGTLKVIEDPKDRRAHRVIATKQGVKIVADIEKQQKQLTAKWLNDIDSTMLDNYFAVLAVLADKSKEQ